MKSRNHKNPEDLQHRIDAERTLTEAERNPVLSGEESCAVAQAHALLAIEERLAQLCTMLEGALSEIVKGSRPKGSSRVSTSPSMVA